MLAREFSEEFLFLRGRALVWIEPYYDRVHLARAADWLLALEPEAPEPLILAVLTHYLERSVPGGPYLDKAKTSWDDRTYNDAHCARSADVVSRWLREQGASERFIEGVQRPILEHEFGGSPEGDLMQAADSISFLEVDAPLVTSWILKGECGLEKGKEKLDWMFERIRLGPARELAQPYHERACAEVDRLVAEAAA